MMIRKTYCMVVRYVMKNYDSIFLFVGTVLLIYLNVNLVQSEMLLKNALEPKYLYQKTYLVNEEWTADTFDKLQDLMQGTGINCVLRKLYLCVGHTADDAESLLYLSAEALAKREKEDIVQWNQEKNSVIIEGRVKPKCYVREGKSYILIEDQEFKVFGIIEENEIMANRIHVNWKNLDDSHRRVFLEYLEHEEPNTVDRNPVQLQGLTTLKSKTQTFEEYFGDKLSETRLNMDGVAQDRAYEYKKMKYLSIIMEVFVIMGFYYLSELWFKRRKREYMIRRMLGFGFFRLWLTSLRDACIVTLMAVMCTAGVELLQMQLHEVGNLMWNEVYLTIATAFFIAAGIEIILFAVNVTRVVAVNPTQENIESAY